MLKIIKILKKVLHSINMRLNYCLAFILIGVLCLFSYKYPKEVLERGIYGKTKSNLKK